MADFNKVIEEIKETEFINPIDSVRRKYISKFAEMTGRNVICYYSDFLNSNHIDVSITDRDLIGFMTVIHGMDKSKGLDLIIHSPGGEVCATEAIGNYLIEIFGNNIRIFVPQLAMSGGTMLSCIGREIYMGKHSSIGPIDPQCGGVPAHSVVQDYEEAKQEIISNPNTIPFWQPIIGQYPPAFIRQCKKAIELSSEMVMKWLENGKMFEGDSTEIKTEKISNIMEFLNNNEYTKIHSRHINAEKAKEIGLNVIALESNDELQDAILSIHHCYMITFQNTNAVKVIENQNFISYVMRSDDENKR